MMDFADSSFVAAAVERLAAVCVVITSVEWLWHRELIADGALAGWPVSQLARKWTAGPRFGATAGRLLSYPAILWLIGIRLCFALALLLGPTDPEWARAFIALVVVTMSVLMNVRSPYGHDGADQMATISLLALGLGRAVGGDLARTYALWFVAGQSCLAYFTAGAAKLVSPVWRGGAALPGILATNCYGLPRVGIILHRYRALAVAGCWLVIAFECLFPLAVVGPGMVTFGLLACGVAMHLANVVLMRLNTFFWAFVATYPAILFCARG